MTLRFHKEDLVEESTSKRFPLAEQVVKFRGSDYSASGFRKEDLVWKSTKAFFPEQLAKPSDVITRI